MDDAHATDALRVGQLRLSAHRAIYGTVIVMAALAAFDVEGHASYVDLALIVLGPLVALATAHAFSDVADRQIAVGRSLTWPDWRHVLTENAQYLYVAVPPLVVLMTAITEGWDVADSVGLLLVLGTVSLVAWGWYAGRRAGLPVRWIVVTSLGYGAVGVGVIVLELLLSEH